MKRHTVFLFALLALFLAPVVTHAQIALYGGFSAAPVSGASRDLAFGGQVGAYKQTGYAASIVSIGADLRGTFLTRDDFHYYTGAIGPRLAFKAPILPFRPYVEGLIGVGNVKNNANSNTNFNYQVLAGLDTTIFPRVDWRVVEFDYSAVPGQSVNAKIFTTGLVLRIW